MSSVLPDLRHRALSEDFHEFAFVELSPQHRLLPARKAFAALCVITKVRVKAEQVDKGVC